MLIIVGWFFQRGVAILKTLAGQKSMTGEGPEGEKKKHNPNAAEIVRRPFFSTPHRHLVD